MASAAPPQCGQVRGSWPDRMISRAEKECSQKIEVEARPVGDLVGEDMQLRAAISVSAQPRAALYCIQPGVIRG